MTWKTKAWKLKWQIFGKQDDFKELASSRFKYHRDIVDLQSNSNQMKNLLALMTELDEEVERSEADWHFLRANTALRDEDHLNC